VLGDFCESGDLVTGDNIGGLITTRRLLTGRAGRAWLAAISNIRIGVAEGELSKQCCDAVITVISSELPID